VFAKQRGSEAKIVEARLGQLLNREIGYPPISGAKMWQFLFILPLVTSAYVSQLLANRRRRITNLIDEPL
jgi:hypothetical protein